MIDMASIAYGRRHDVPQDKQINKKVRKQESKWASKQTRKKTNKQKDEQKMVSMREKCRFGPDFHSFITMKYGRRTSKQD